MPLFARLRRRLFIFQIFLLLIGSGVVAYTAQRAFETDLQPDMTQKGEIIARSLAGQFERALELGVAFQRLRGVDELFAGLRHANREILFIAALDADGRDRRTQVFVDGEVPADADFAALSALLPADQALVGGSSADRTVRWENALIASQAIQVGNKRVGWVLVGIDADYVREQLSGLLYDILVVLAVSLLMTFEILLLLMSSAASPMLAVQAVVRQACGGTVNGSNISQQWPTDLVRLASGFRQVVNWLHLRHAMLARGPSSMGKTASGTDDLGKVEAALDALTSAPAGDGARHGRQGSLVRVRMPLFIFFLSEELSRPFFPIFAKSLATSVAGLSPEVVTSLPMILFMLVVAFSQPFGGPWAERFGARRMMCVGSLVGAVGLALTAFAWDFYSLLAWRFLTAAGYGIVFVAGQSHVIANTDPDNRSWGMAMFVGSVLAASICGPAIGGILADRIGYSWTFAVGAATALAAGGLACRLLPTVEGSKGIRGAVLRLKDVSLVLGNPRFLALLIGGAMPAKIILTGFLYYLCPLYLAHLGNSPSATGRIVMLYGLLMVLVTPLAARFADRLRRPLVFVIGGGTLSALGTLGVLWSSSTTMLIVAVVILGFAQALSITPQLTLVPFACPAECQRLGQVTVIGFFRLFERIGSALGPLLAALLLQGFGYSAAAGAIGAGVGVASLMLGVAWMATVRRAKSPNELVADVGESGPPAHVTPLRQERTEDHGRNQRKEHACADGQDLASRTTA